MRRIRNVASIMSLNSVVNLNYFILIVTRGNLLIENLAAALMCGLRRENCMLISSYSGLSQKHHKSLVSTLMLKFLCLSEHPPETALQIFSNTRRQLENSRERGFS